jgi:hypothetical protein
MFNEQISLFTKNKLSWDIKKILFTLGLVGSMGSTANAAKPIARYGTDAFSIWNQYVEQIKVGPAITVIDGKSYLQYITPDAQASTYRNIIAGPVDKLMDRTISWDDIIYSSQTFVLDALSNSEGVLVDLNNDGINTLIVDKSEYDIVDLPLLITDDVSDGLTVGSGTLEPPVFVDVDGDNDLDMLFINSKYSSPYYYENTGSVAAPDFVYRDVDIEDISEQYRQTLPSGFSEYYKSVYGYYPNFLSHHQLLPFDFDSDGDQDVLLVYPNVLLKYYEHSQNNGIDRYSEPFNIIPTRENEIAWITDYDSDGDLDVLTTHDMLTPYQPGQSSDLLFHERINNTPAQYAPPVTLTNYPNQIAYTSANKSSISHSKEVFRDLDNDGIQELLTSTESGGLYKFILLRKNDDNSFEQKSIYQDRGNYGRHAQFVDGSNDIAFHSWNEEIQQESILFFKHEEGLNYSAPITLDSDALELNRNVDQQLQLDFDADGDIDTVYNHSITWNLTSTPGSVTNFSTRSYVGEGSNILIGGFIIEGESPQTVILRGIGPSLSTKGVQEPLNDPELYLFSGSKIIAHNDNWQSANGADKIESAGIALEHSNEAALRVRLNPGVYTVHLTGKPNDTGVGIFAVDIDNQMPTNSLQVNISSRAFVKNGEDIAIGGLTIEGDTPVKVLIRGLGPLLQESGVENTLTDPSLTLFSGNTIIATNNNWKNSANASEIASLENAPTYDSEAAILIDLEPGTYTVHLRDASGESGVGIVAIDRLP